MSGHIKYPWRNDGTYISDATGMCIDPNVMGGEEVASRIVACVNACAGLPQDALDGGWTALGMSKYAKSVESQRDELLELVKQSYRKQNAEYLELLSKYAGTRFEHDPAIVRAKGWVKKADELIAQAEAR